jgi:hypothetical protein
LLQEKSGNPEPEDAKLVADVEAADELSPVLKIESSVPKNPYESPWEFFNTGV